MNTREKVDIVDEFTKLDPEYREMLMECRLLEKKVMRILETLPGAEHDLVWDFIMLCESMSERKLWLACDWLK